LRRGTPANAVSGIETAWAPPLRGRMVGHSWSQGRRRAPTLGWWLEFLRHSLRRFADGLASFLQALRARPELLLFGALLAVCNWPVLIGSACGSLVFRPAAVEAGEWWRLFTHPWVHVTWYHLLLDGVAFLMLYESLAERSLSRRLTYVFAAGAGGLLISWWAAPAIGSHGLCGLSGIAHGLMAVSAIEMMAGHSLRSPPARFGRFTFLLVVGKAMVEAISGRMFFTFLHFGLMGDPVAVSHAGGVLGGLLAMLWLGRRSRPALRRND